MPCSTLVRYQQRKKGSKQNVSALFLYRFARRYRPPGVRERGARFGDFQRDAAARIARARKCQALGQRHRPSVELQMRAGIVLEKSDNELGLVGAAIALERLRRYR